MIHGREMVSLEPATTPERPPPSVMLYAHCSMWYVVCTLQHVVCCQTRVRMTSKYVVLKMYLYSNVSVDVHVWACWCVDVACLSMFMCWCVQRNTFSNLDMTGTWIKINLIMSIYVTLWYIAFNALLRKCYVIDMPDRTPVDDRPAIRHS